jgi:hypothetical protein
MATIYLETTIPSYLTSRPSRDLVVAAHQQLTHQWWERAHQHFDIAVSEVVVAEIEKGDPEFAARRMKLIAGLPVLGTNEDVVKLAEIYSTHLGLHPGAKIDILHIAFAVSFELDYLVTWNCKHIANGQVIRRLAKINQRHKRPTPVIVTPEELLPRDQGETP